ncbi:histidine kinase [uncultured Actinomyces sp.]|mgnify:FL=1|uniref:sensor histidine kinase n=1 Tax=uncultured Actinomyces sp. TaxID=249061 RepID=UPI0028D30D40|nr:histidine kinase [uncultured Actinomyces sp.]
MVPFSRSSSFFGIGVYIDSTHVTLVITATVVAPVLSYFDAGPPLRAAIRIVAVALVGGLGAGALLAERRPDHRFSNWWRRPLVNGSWTIALVLASVVLTTADPIPAQGITPTIAPLALAFRAAVAGSLSFWIASSRVAVTALICFFGSRLLLSLTGLEPNEPALTIAIASTIAFAVLGQDMVYALALEVDDLRATEAQRAVTQERQRFAGDLHDIQGQNLQLLAAEAQIVQRLITAERYEEAGERAARVRQIAAAAVDEMHGIVYAYRKVDINDEIMNAIRVLEAAGISMDTKIDLPPNLTDTTVRLLGLTIREGVTNVLRHTQARSCRLTVHQEPGDNRIGVLLPLEDSGPVAPRTIQRGSGIFELGRRYMQVGGRLSLTTTETEGSRLEGWLPVAGEGISNQ